MISTASFTWETDVAYSDIGPDQLLDHRGTLRLLQEAAAIASDERGYGIKDIRRNGVFWILAGWRLELIERCPWRSHLAIQTWPRSLEGYTSDRDFLVWHGDILIARATSRWLLVSTETGRAVRVTDQVRSAYELDSRTLFDTPIPSNSRTPDGTPTAFSTVVGRRDIDTNHHVNNIHYLDYALEALPEALCRRLPRNLEIAFRRQILLGTPIRCLCSVTADGKYQVEIQSGEDKIVRHAFLWFYD